MKIWSGIITDKLATSREFYLKLLDAEVLFESEWFVLLTSGDNQLGLMLPNLDNQAPMFRAPVKGPGVWLAIDVDDVDAHYRRVKSLGIPIALDIRDEPWGDRHFAVTDPNGIGVDFVRHQGVE
ncbi:VOC family protein [Aliiglaciecola sp. CAU 1673]|uniref:VOC family protein n=1 Tax=Aliiglaciecola sp. CAU 1673 TaxID=3032595 RepID=UPI0023D9ACCD|nr:VOC family protein [Aliiglaciecola sp. CAU 1673]MDF2178097.1 VOC family protein [Aliiglaciecola sp. CAU 1673]